MSRRIAHRPRYRNMRRVIQPPPRTRKDFFPTRWTYRRLIHTYQKPVLGQGLLRIPFYQFVHSIRL